MNPKRLGFQSVIVNFGTFNHDMQCLFGPPEHLVKYIRWAMDDPEFDWDTQRKRGGCFSQRGYVPIVWLPRKPRTPHEHGCLAHEVLHALRFLLVEWAGIEFNAHTDEVFCHAMSHAVGTIMERAR
jgi:hypothetical protein